MSTAAQEVAIISCCQAQGKDPRKADEYYGILGNAEKLPGGWMWTRTGLLVPPGYEKDQEDQGGYPRIVFVTDAVKGIAHIDIVRVPKSGIVVSWNTRYGIPRETRVPEKDEPYEGHNFHFEFDPYMEEAMIGLRWAVVTHKFKKNDVEKPENEREKPKLDDVCLGMHASLGSSIKLNHGKFRPVKQNFTS